MSADIVLATLNARFTHASLGLRYLLANLGELRQHAVLRELVLGVDPEEAAARWLAERPRIIGLSVAIWNVAPLTRAVAWLKATAPEVVIVLGGPEVSHEVEGQRICALADYVVTGWGELTFARLARAILACRRPAAKVHPGERAPLPAIRLPYDEFTDDDLGRRRLYVEASRGCPFRCAFCLSALDRTAWPFPREPLLAELARLWERGARRFTFVDRTFNLRLDTAGAVLGFFLERIAARPADPPFLHFEMIPDRLPDRLRVLLAAFPPGTLQLEIGVQTFNPRVQSLIDRRQDQERTECNLRWLRDGTAAHLHADLIVGLPGEDLQSFAAGFDRLYRLGPHEIQVGLLKRLRGAPLNRLAGRFGLEFAAEPPYTVLATDRIDRPTMARLARFAALWERVGNSGRFGRILPLLLAEAPFDRFLAWSDWFCDRLGRAHAIALESLYEGLHDWLAPQDPAARAALVADYADSGARGRLAFAPERRPPPPRVRAPGPTGATPPRQARHLRPRNDREGD